MTNVPMGISGYYAKNYKYRSGKDLLLHIGPGRENYIDVWVNLDSNIIDAKIDVWANLEHAIPFRDRVLRAAYSHHVIEHLVDLDLHFKELYGCLKPGGVIRVGGSNGDEDIKNFASNNGSWFSDFPIKRDSHGSRMNSFIMCANEHLHILTFDWLEEILLSAGFGDIRLFRPVMDMSYPVLFGEIMLKSEREWDMDNPHALVIGVAKSFD